jgi:hypothetical protein
MTAKPQHCGHRCCSVPANPCHTHMTKPPECQGCAASRQAERRAPGEESVITAVVMRSIVPQISGLPVGRELDRLVAEQVRAHYLGALDDGALADLDANEWCGVVAARVGLALAFPHVMAHG